MKDGSKYHHLVERQQSRSTQSTHCEGHLPTSQDDPNSESQRRSHPSNSFSSKLLHHHHPHHPHHPLSKLERRVLAGNGVENHLLRRHHQARASTERPPKYWRRWRRRSSVPIYGQTTCNQEGVPLRQLQDIQEQHHQYARDAVNHPDQSMTTIRTGTGTADLNDTFPPSQSTTTTTTSPGTIAANEAIAENAAANATVQNHTCTITRPLICHRYSPL